MILNDLGLCPFFFEYYLFSIYCLLGQSEALHMCYLIHTIIQRGNIVIPTPTPYTPPHLPQFRKKTEAQRGEMVAHGHLTCNHRLEMQ